MYFIIYSSIAADGLSEEDLKTILESSEKNNQANQITGMLILFNGTFIQMLEGEKEDVDSTFSKIERDNRHSNVLKLFYGQTDERHFPNWKMAMEVVDDHTFRKIEGYESLEEGDRFLSEVDDDHAGLKILRYLYEQKKR